MPSHSDWLNFRLEDLRGQVAVVTGGSSGIGLAAAQALAGCGCRVVVAGRNAERVAAAVTMLDGALGVADCDVGRATDVERLFAETSQRFGPVDILITSAISVRNPAGKLPKSVAQLAEEDWDDVLNSGLKGVFLTNRAAAQSMVPRGRGQILNLSSAYAARRGYAFGGAYCAAKFAVTALTEALAAELAPVGIRVLSLLPGVVDTPLVSGTQLGKHGKLTPADVGTWIALMAALPLDIVLDNPVLLPFGAPPAPR